MGELDGRVIAIAGAGGGLGPSVVASGWPSAGATLAATDVSQERLDQLRRRTSAPRSAPTAAPSTCSTRARPRRGRRDLRERFGRVDGAAAPGRRLARRRPDRRGAARRTTSGCTTCSSARVQHTTRAFHDALTDERATGASCSSPPRRRSGPTATNAAYAAAKAAAESWTLALADSFAGPPATANIVVVNAILTPQMREQNPDKEFRTFTAAEQIAEAIGFRLLRRRREDERPAAITAPVSATPPARVRLRQPLRRPSRGARRDRRGQRRPRRRLRRRRAGPRAARRASSSDTSATRPSRSWSSTAPAPTSCALDALTRPYEASSAPRSPTSHVDECGAPGAGRRRQAAHGRRRGRQADARPTFAAGRRRRGDEHHGAAAGRLDHPGHRARHRLHAGGVAGDRRRRPRARDVPARRRRPARQRGGLARACRSRALTTDAGVDVALLRRHQERPAASARPSSSSPGARRGLPLHPQAARRSSPRRCASSRPSSRRCSDGDLWRANAAHANAMARRLADAIAAIDGVEIAHPVQANGVFANLPAAGDRPPARRAARRAPLLRLGRGRRRRSAGCARGTPPRRTSTPSRPRSPRRCSGVRGDNLEMMRRGYEHFVATGQLSEERMDPEFVWDMSTFRNWPERQTYEGIEGTREFLTEWIGAWEDWKLERGGAPPGRRQGGRGSPPAGKGEGHRNARRHALLPGLDLPRRKAAPDGDVREPEEALRAAGLGNAEGKHPSAEPEGR